MENVISKTHWLLALILCTALASFVRGQDASLSVEDRIRKMSATLGAATAFQFEADVLSDVPGPGGQMIQYGRHATVLIRRPGELKAIVQGERENFIVTIGNQKFSIIDPSRKVYATAVVPENLDQSLPVVNEKKLFATPLANFLLSNPYGTFLTQAQSSERIGTSIIDGVTCDHVAIRQNDTDIQLWLEANEQSLPRRLNIIYKKQPSMPHLSATMSKWNLNPIFDDKTFTFQPPADGFVRPVEEVHPMNPATTQPGK